MKNIINFDKYDFLDGDTVVVGVSGGPDSMFILDTLIKYKKLRIVVAHINHNIRKQSIKDLRFVESFCNANNLIFESMLIEEYGDDNFHNEARNIRYHFFENLVDKYDAKCLITAHHGDDLIETILMRLVRGSTLKGYGGFKELSYYNDMKIIRPMLYLTKDEILSYNRKNRIKSVIDKSNFKTKYTRNRYRKFIIPFLKKEEKNVHLKFLKYSNLLNDSNDYLEQLVNKEKLNIYVENKLNIDKFNKQDEIIKERIIFNVLEEFYQDDLLLINDRHVSLIMDLINSKNPNSEVYLPNNILAKKNYNTLSFEREIDEITNYEIEISEEVILPNNHVIKKVDSASENDNNICRLDSNEIKLPLYVRTRKHGDKIALFHSSGHSKIKNILIDNKIDLKQRDMWPIVCDANDTIIWIPGLKKSKYCKQKNQTCDIILRYD